MSRRKRRASHANHDRWLVSYADFITLLFAFFVVLYASSQVDKRKVGKLALAIQVAFQEMGVFQASTTEVPVDVTDPMPFSKAQAIENAHRTPTLRLIAPPPQAPLHLPGNRNCGASHRPRRLRCRSSERCWIRRVSPGRDQSHRGRPRHEPPRGYRYPRPHPGGSRRRGWDPDSRLDPSRDKNGETVSGGRNQAYEREGR